MRSSNHNASRAAKIMSCEWQNGNRHNHFINVNLNALRSKHTCSSFGKIFWIVTSIISNSNADFPVIFAFKVTCKTECCFTNSVAIHSVWACAHNTSQTACTKSKVFIKSILNFLIVCNTFKLGFCIFIRKRKPLQIFILISHNNTSNKIHYIYIFYLLQIAKK